MESHTAHAHEHREMPTEGAALTGIAVSATRKVAIGPQPLRTSAHRARSCSIPVESAVWSSQMSPE